jgi:hypothetical protein
MQSSRLFPSKSVLEFAKGLYPFLILGAAGLCVAAITSVGGGYKGPRVVASDVAVAPQSHCYVPGEAHKRDTHPCVTVDGGDR